MRQSVPSAPPEMVNVSSVQGSSSIIVSWREVSCQHRNGEIVGYVVEYKTSATRQRRQTKEMIVMVDGQATIINDLEPLTEYSIMVAAVNSNGTGQFSEPVTIVTHQGKPRHCCPISLYTTIICSWSIVTLL